MNKQQQWHAGYVVAAILGVVLTAQLWGYAQSITVIPYSQFLERPQRRQDRRGARFRGLYRRLVERRRKPTASRRFITTRVSPDLAAELEKNHVRFSGQVQNNWLQHALSWVLPTLVFFGLWEFWFRALREQPGRRRRTDGDRPQQGQGLCRDRHQDDVQGRRRRRRSQGGAAGDRRFSEEPERLRPARGAHAEGRAAGRPAGHRQDAARPGGRGRGRRAVLLDQRLGVRRDVRRRRRRAGARPVRAGAQEGAGDHLH